MADIEQEIRASAQRIAGHVQHLTGARLYFPAELGDNDFEHALLALLVRIVDQLGELQLKDLAARVQRLEEVQVDQDEPIPYTLTSRYSEDTVRLGHVAYQAYAHSVGYRSVRGERLPVWDGVGGRIQAGWIAAAAAVLRDVFSGVTVE